MYPQPQQHHGSLYPVLAAVLGLTAFWWDILSLVSGVCTERGVGGSTHALGKELPLRVTFLFLPKLSPLVKGVGA